MPKRGRKKKIINDQLSIINDNKEIGQKSRSKGGKAAVKILTAPDNKESQGAISARNSDVSEPQFNQGKEEQKNKLIMWLGIGGVMIVFFVAWIFNLKYEFKASLKKSDSSGFNWSQTKSELDKAMAQVKQGLNEVKKIQANLKSKATAGPRYAESSGEASQAELTPEQINLLKGKLLNEVATGTASSTKINVK